MSNTEILEKLKNNHAFCEQNSTLEIFKQLSLSCIKDVPSFTKIFNILVHKGFDFNEHTYWSRNGKPKTHENIPLVLMIEKIRILGDEYTKLEAIEKNELLGITCELLKNTSVEYYENLCTEKKTFWFVFSRLLHELPCVFLDDLEFHWEITHEDLLFPL